MFCIVPVRILVILAHGVTWVRSRLDTSAVLRAYPDGISTRIGRIHSLGCESVAYVLNDVSVHTYFIALQIAPQQLI